MRLTNNLRDAFVRAAMDDVPSIDYAEKGRVIIQADAVSKLPAPVRAIYDNAKLRHFVATRNLYHQVTGYVSAVGTEGTISPAAKAQLDAWGVEYTAQNVSRHDLQHKLRAVAYACKTRKDLVTMLPEFEKYMPADDVAACRTLPVVANVVSDFVKAGWPKGEKPKAAAPAKAARVRTRK